MSALTNRSERERERQVDRNQAWDSLKTSSRWTNTSFPIAVGLTGTTKANGSITVLFPSFSFLHSPPSTAQREIGPRERERGERQVVLFDCKELTCNTTEEPHALLSAKRKHNMWGRGMQCEHVSGACSVIALSALFSGQHYEQCESENERVKTLQRAFISWWDFPLTSVVVIVVFYYTNYICCTLSLKLSFTENSQNIFFFFNQS